MKTLTPYFSSWRTTVVRDREIVDAVVAPEHRPPSQEFAVALAGWEGTAYWTEGAGDGRIVLIRRLGRPPRERWWLHIGLFLLTFFTVWMGGALLAGAPAPFAMSFLEALSSFPTSFADLTRDLFAMRPGLDFAMALMAILLAHEMGHYLLAKRYGIDASPPYFLPAPPFVNFIGTFGAFIRLRSPIVDRRQLLDVGAAGPWAGFVVAMVALLVGLSRSTAVPEVGASDQFITIAQFHLYLGDSPLMYAARRLVAGEGTILLHPLAFAGWLGLFVTMLNLLPLGQLDGGHVLYALIGERQKLVGPVVWFGLLALGLLPGQWWWWLWAVIILFLGRGRLAHPQVLDRYSVLPRRRRPLGWATVALFVVTFTPMPIHPL